MAQAFTRFKYCASGLWVVAGKWVEYEQDGESNSKALTEVIDGAWEKEISQNNGSVILSRKLSVRKRRRTAIFRSMKMMRGCFLLLIFSVNGRLLWKYCFFCVLRVNFCRSGLRPCAWPATCCAIVSVWIILTGRAFGYRYSVCTSSAMYVRLIGTFWLSWIATVKRNHLGKVKT